MHRVKAAVHRASVFVYIKFGMDVGEGGKHVEKKLSVSRTDEIICLIEGIGNGKRILMSNIHTNMAQGNILSRIRYSSRCVWVCGQEMQRWQMQVEPSYTVTGLRVDREIIKYIMGLILYD